MAVDRGLMEHVFDRYSGLLGEDGRDEVALTTPEVEGRLGIEAGLLTEIHDANCGANVDPSVCVGFATVKGFVAGLLVGRGEAAHNSSGFEIPPEGCGVHPLEGGCCSRGTRSCIINHEQEGEGS